MVIDKKRHKIKFYTDKDFEKGFFTLIQTGSSTHSSNPNEFIISGASLHILKKKKIKFKELTR